MKYLLAIALQLLIVSSAQACHHYAVWKYPWPQPRCGLAARGTDPDARIWYVEITKLPPLDEREIGIEKLKHLMGGENVGR